MWGSRVACVSVVALVVAGCSESAEDKFNAHVVEHGLSVSMVQAGTENLGTDACKDIRGGNAAANEVIGITNDTHLTEPQAEIVVYWAIADICPDQSAQNQEHWRDGS